MGHVNTWHISYNTAQVPIIASFEEAEKRFKATKPIRSKQAAGRRPLGARNRHHMASIAMPDDNTVQLCYYDKPLVTWRSDNTFEVSSPTYHSAYVVQNIHAFLPKDMWFEWNHGRMCLVHKNKRFLLPHDKSFKFKATPDSTEMIDVPIEYAIRKKRGMEKKYLKDCEPFLEWMELVQSIDNLPKIPEQEMTDAMNELYKSLSCISEAEFDKWYEDNHSKDPIAWTYKRNREALPHSGRGYWRRTPSGYHTQACKILMDWITSPLSENWVTAYYVIMKQQGQGGHVLVGNSREWIRTLTRDSAVEYIKETILHLHRDECFAKEPLGEGEVPTKQNTEYFNVYDQLV